jgi:hypothetical protein
MVMAEIHHRYFHHRPLQPPGDGKDLPKFPVTPRDYAGHTAKSLSERCIVEARTSVVSDILMQL